MQAVHGTEMKSTLTHAAEAQSFFRLSSNYTPTGSLQEEADQIPATNLLHRADSVNSTACSSTTYIYECYKVPLANALLYKASAAPYVRAQSPNGISDTFTDVDSGFNDTKRQFQYGPLEMLFSVHCGNFVKKLLLRLPTQWQIQDFL